MGADGGDGTHEGILEDIVGGILVANQKEDIVEQLVLIAAEQDIKSIVVPFFVQTYQLVVGKFVECSHYCLTD